MGTHNTVQCSKEWLLHNILYMFAVYIKLLEEHAAQLSKESPGPDESVDDGKADIDVADAAVVSALGRQVQDVSHSARSLSAGGRQSNLQRAMSQLTAADSMLLSADLLDTGSSHESQPPAEEKESQQGSKEVAPGDCLQVAVNIAFPHEVFLEHAKAWQGRWAVHHKKSTMPSPNASVPMPLHSFDSRIVIQQHINAIERAAGHTQWSAEGSMAGSGSPA